MGSFAPNSSLNRSGAGADASDRLDELRDKCLVLFPVGFNAGADIYAIGVGEADGIFHILGIEASGEEYWDAGLLDLSKKSLEAEILPRKGFPSASGLSLDS